MIKKEELRIGNWVHHNVSMWSYRNDDGVISNFDDNFQWNESDWYALGECTLGMECIEPIKLTEEWLIKFGFKYDDDECEFMSLELLAGLKIHSDISDKFSVCTLVLNRKMTIGIEYVHQLQNLHFALTGYELTV